jgi:SHS2 domain-containing protein
VPALGLLYAPSVRPIPSALDPMTTRRGHEQTDHTADLGLRFWAPTEAELLVEAARALTDVLTGGKALAARASRHVRVEALDPEDRLVQWLNEVLVLATVQGMLFVDAELSLGQGGELEAELELVHDPSAIVTELKSVTYHALELHRRTEGPTHDGWVGQVVVDV